MSQSLRHSLLLLATDGAAPSGVAATVAAVSTVSASLAVPKRLAAVVASAAVVSAAVTGPATGGPGDTNILAHPAAFRRNGSTSWITTQGQNEIVFNFVGTSLSVEIDDSGPAGAGAVSNDRFNLSVSIDGGVYGGGGTAISGGVTDLGGNIKRLPLASGLSSGTHTARVLILRGGNNTLDLIGAADPPTGALVIRRFCASDGSDLATAPFTWLRTNTMVSYGDSRGYLGVSGYGVANWLGAIASALDANDVRIVNAGQGVAHTNVSITPTLQDGWDLYYTGQARPTMADVEYVCVFSFGANDVTGVVSNATYQAAVEEILTGVLALYPSAIVFAMPDVGGFYRTPFLAAVAAVGSARITLIDLYASRPEYQPHFDNSPSSTATLYSSDGVHTAQAGIPIIGGWLAGAVARAVAGRARRRPQ